MSRAQSCNLELFTVPALSRLDRLIDAHTVARWRSNPATEAKIDTETE
ncbi:MAG: hypothetical protein ACXWLW_02250 [Rhizomicrobium sp.]